MSEKILFMCPDNAAKSIITMGYFPLLAADSGVNASVDTAGTEPDESVWPTVVELLRADGVDVAQEVPRLVTAEDLKTATRVVSLGCDLTGLGDTTTKIEHWDVPMPSAGLTASRDAVLAHVKTLIAELCTT